jgi:hypothetical protein
VREQSLQMKAYKEAERFYGPAFNNPSDTESAVLNIKTDNFYGFYQTAAHKYFEKTSISSTFTHFLTSKF